MDKPMYYIVVNFNSCGLCPDEIASISKIFKTYQAALKCLEDEYEQLKAEGYTEYKLDLDEGTLIDNQNCRGHYVQGVVMWDED